MGSAVRGVCSVCGKRFTRAGDLSSFSSSHGTPPRRIPEDASKATKYSEWVLACGSLCDDHIPPVPKAVLADIDRELRRKQSSLVKQSKTELSGTSVQGTIERNKRSSNQRGWFKSTTNDISRGFATD